MGGVLISYSQMVGGGDLNNTFEPMYIKGTVYKREGHKLRLLLMPIFTSFTVFPVKIYILAVIRRDTYIPLADLEGRGYGGRNPPFQISKIKEN